ncbi:hypothetical protein IQ273_12605 [Nodosilinea sp. LEGE 07298]|jgi:hypothetical protein|uniref:hypothetical protein n=1 Tax=Nodosilinea sp. LEGE 07298 TaxID=2777970 RepID=UPI0018807C7B|nr:hypothetical protein [Nodosilinea sp. LEGE 07298]MBE9110252.1 hypothetical protein [Nodosilinea sp. LEGE 07298]
MSSPFSTFEEFEGAIDGPTGGAIYTFANSPAINTIALLICVGLFIWFLVRTFSTHYEVPAVDKSLNHLSALIVAGLVSLAGAEYRQTTQPHQSTETQPQATIHQPGAKSALGLLGLAGVGLPLRSRGSKASRRKGLYRDIKSSR